SSATPLLETRAAASCDAPTFRPTRRFAFLPPFSSFGARRRRGCRGAFSFLSFGCFGAFSPLGAFSGFAFFSFGCFDLPPPNERSFFQNGTFSDGTGGSSAAGTGGWTTTGAAGSSTVTGSGWTVTGSGWTTGSGGGAGAGVGGTTSRWTVQLP